MNAASEAPLFAQDPSKLKKPWTPKKRHHAIYRAAVVECRTQLDIAIEFAVDQSTVSRIVKKYEAWRARATDKQLAAADGDGLNATERKRLEHWLARQRNQAIYRRAMRLAEVAESPQIVTRKGSRGENEFQDETKRDQIAVACRFLRLAMQASDSLHKLSDQPPPPPPQGPFSDQELFKRLLEIRREAEKEGRAPKSEVIFGTVKNWLRALCGDAPSQRTKPGYVPGTPGVEMMRAIMDSESKPYDLEERAQVVRQWVQPILDPVEGQEALAPPPEASSRAEEGPNNEPAVHKMHNCIRPPVGVTAARTSGCAASRGAEKNSGPVPHAPAQRVPLNPPAAAPQPTTVANIEPGQKGPPIRLIWPVVTVPTSGGWG